MTTMQTENKKHYHEAGRLYKQARELMEQWEGKTAEEGRPSDIEDQLDKLFEAGDQAKAQAQRLDRYEDSGRFLQEVEEAKRLPLDASVQKGDPDIAVKAFDMAMRGQAADLNPDQRAALRDLQKKVALNEGTPGQGGYAVPVLYANDLTSALNIGSILRTAGADVRSYSGTNSLHFPTLVNSATAVLVTETTAFDEVEPTMSEVVFVPYKYTRLVKASDEVLADSRLNMYTDIIGPDINNAFVLAENAAFTVGTGSSQPQGVVAGSTLGVTLASTTVATADEIVDLQFSLAYQYRPRAKFMAADATIKAWRKLVTGVSGDKTYLWAPGLSASQPDTLLGSPILPNNSIVTGQASAKIAIYGDFSYFRIVDFAALEIKMLNELYAGTGQVGWRAYKRVDSHLMLATAMYHMICHA